MSLEPHDPATDLVLEGAPPGSGHPSWLALIVAVVVAVLVGSVVGYGIGASPAATPTLAALPSRSASPQATAGVVFNRDPCRLVVNLSILTALPDPITSARDSDSALPGMADCTYLNASGQILASLSLRQAPTRVDELAVIVDEVFQGGEIAELSTSAAGPGFLIACATAWTPCRTAVAVVREPYFLVVSLPGGHGDVRVALALVAQIVGSLRD